MLPQSPVQCQRAVLSCARCRRRKIKCDRRLPSCSRCVAAGSPCTGFHSSRNTAIPRSLVQHLEQEVARAEDGVLEQQAQDPLLQTHRPPSASPITEVITLNQAQHGPSPHTPSNVESASALTPLSENHLRNYDYFRDTILRSHEVKRMINATIPSNSSKTDLARLVRLGFTPSAVLSPLRGYGNTRNDTRKESPARMVDVSTLISLPSNIIEGLVNKFVHSVLPIYPFLEEPEVWAQVQRVLEKIPRQGDSSSMQSATSIVEENYDFLIVYLILAISPTLGSAKSSQEAKCIKLSESLFNEGIQHARVPIPSALRQIQANLLILQYACINPKSANVWIINGMIMRSCIGLGLHREAVSSAHVDRSQLELGRQIFWVAYYMDRAICSVLRRPLSIPDTAIDMTCPLDITDTLTRRQNNSTQTSNNPHLNSLGRSSALHWIQYARIRSVVTEVHFQSKPLDPDQSWEDWLATQEAAFRQWHHSSRKDEWVEFAFHHGVMSVHRPSPRSPMPSPQSLVIAFEAASSAARTCREDMTEGFFRRPWLTAHHTLEMATVVLFCLRHGLEVISARFDAEEIFNMTKVFTANFLTHAKQGWSDIVSYAGVYERLLGPLLEAVFNNNTTDTSACFSPAQDAELTRLLYPQPAQREQLRFVGRTVSPMQNDDEIFLPFDTSILEWDSDGLGSAPHDFDKLFLETCAMFDENHVDTDPLVL